VSERYGGVFTKKLNWQQLAGRYFKKLSFFAYQMRSISNSSIALPKLVTGIAARCEQVRATG